jgi:4-amino-4-deoxy-L-arabinose transferase-like glycosyltransferase
MDGSIALAPRMETMARRALRTLRRLDSQPQAANLLLMGCWGVTRLILVLGMVLGRHYCDPNFYNYAGQFAAGRWPYRTVPVEYPPLAVLLLLLPALPLLPFANIAPRPDPAFHANLTAMPSPDILRYSAYGLSFAVEMLLVDVVTLWLIRLAARRFLPRDGQGLRVGLLYIFIVFLNGALLQKFDLAAGTLVLAAMLALVGQRRRTAWLLLAAATLVKGFPILLLPLFALYLVSRRRGAGRAPVGMPWGVAWQELRTALVWCGGALVIVTVPVALFAGIGPIWHTVAYHAGRGTEIESLYATVMLALGWLPRLGVTTAFNGADLSRVVLSPLDSYVDVASYVLLAALLLAAYVVSWRTWTSRAMAAVGTHTSWEAEVGAVQVLGLGTVAVLLAFMLSFRALPIHYLLVIVPLLALLRLPGRRAGLLWWVGIVGAAVAGQLIVARWDALRALDPWAVVVLGARNLCWLLLFGLALGGQALWLRTIAPVAVAVPAAPRVAWRKRLLRRWRRLIASAPPIPGFTPREEDVAVHLFSHVSPAALVLGAGACTAAIYLAFVLAFPLTLLYSHPHVGSDPNIINDMGHITGYSPLAAIGFVGAILVLFACQFLAVIGAGRLAAEKATAGRKLDRVARWSTWLFPVAFILIMLWMQPVTTTDLYGYVARGYLYVFNHGNPMTMPATQLPGGLEVNRPAAPYGPVWLLIAGLVSRVAGENLLVNMLLFKLIAAVATLGTLVLLDVLVRQLSPQRRLRVLVLFGWSPLLIFEAIGNGHNDIVMMLCVVAAFALMLRGKSRMAFTLLVVGALVKYVAAFFIPLWLVYELRRRSRAMPTSESSADVAPSPEGTSADEAEPAGTGRFGGMVLGHARALALTFQDIDRRQAISLLASVGVIGGVLVAVAYAPFWVGLHTFTGLGTQLRPLYYNNSLVGFFTAPLQLLVSPKEFGPLDKTVRLVCYVSFGIYVLIQVNRLWRWKPALDLHDVITSAAKITFAALILITFWYQPWYVVWLLPLAALSQEPYVRRAAAILAAGSLLTYAVSSFLFVNDTGLGQALFVQFFQILVTFGPLLLLRAAPYEGGLLSIGRRYLGTLGMELRQHPVFWERVMLVLVLIVAALLRLLRLGNLFARIDTSSTSPDGLRQLSGDLGVFLADPQGLRASFLLLQGVLVHIFGPTPFAVLLPAAVVGTVTVFVIYLLAKEIMHQGGIPGEHGVGLVAALLAATSQWHVSLSRAGVEVVLLPLLTCTALYWLLLAFRLGRPPGAQDRVAAGIRKGSRKLANVPGELDERNMRSCLLLYAACGVCTGLACDLAPGLWLLPLLVIGFLLVWRWRLPEWFGSLRIRLGVLLGSAFVSGLPAIGYLVGSQIGFRAGSFIFARTSQHVRPGPGLLTLAFWGRVASNIGGVLQLLVGQDFTAGYPAVGGTPIIPVLLAPVFIVGLLIIIARWRNLASLALLLLIALPIVASVAIGTPANAIEAACVLPAICIVPALALYEVAVFFGHLPIFLDRVNGSRIFTTPEQIGRVLLLVFLTISTIRTFYWYFEASLPARPPNEYVAPTYVAPSPKQDTIVLVSSSVRPQT